MDRLVYIALIGWIPAILLLFAALPARRTVVVVSVAASLFLPVAVIALPGLPDLTKMSATTAGLFLGSLLFDAGRMSGLRPRWFDLPILSWCLMPLASSVTNDLGAYDGLAGVLNQVVTWGLPYLIGRAYFRDLDGLRELAVGIVIGGLIYIPLCLWEIRMSPQLHRVVYGYNPHSFGQTIRFGGYRPQVFMKHGLELGMWMIAASLASFWMWTSGTLKELRGVRFGWPLLILIGTTVLCKSTGALVLLAVGIALYFAMRWTGSRLPALVLIAITPLYLGTRATGVWSGTEMVGLSRATVGADREDSLRFRLDNENILVARALQRPILGWGGWGRARVFDEEGKDLSITDGLWVIALGNYGLVGLVSIFAVLLMPLALLLVRFPVSRWSCPDVAPAAALAVLVALYAIDCLMNAMVNPIYSLAIGGLVALGGRGAVCRSNPRDDPDEEEQCGEPPDSDSRGPESGHAHEDEAVLREAIELHNRRTTYHPEVPEHRRDLARSHETMGAFLTDHCRAHEARAALGRGLDLWESLTGRHPDRDEYRDGLADARNNLAWLLACGPGVESRDPAISVRLARAAVDHSPGRAAYWNTLGATLHRAGDWPAAIAALERSVALGTGGDGFDFLLMAMACWRRGDTGRARDWYERGAGWMHEHAPACAELQRLHHEAADLLSHRSIDGRAG